MTTSDQPGTAAPFAVTAPAELRLAGDRTGATTFSVTNLTGRPVRARLRARGGAGAPDDWFSVTGESEIPMSIGLTMTAEVKVAVPAGVPAGEHSVHLEVVLEDDTEAVSGQSVSFTVPAPAARRTPWAMIIALIVVLLLLVAAAVWFIAFRDNTPSAQPAPTPTLTPIPTPTPVPTTPKFDPTCVQGYVWRAARETDLVCVTLETREQTRLDNLAAPTRWVAGAYGPHTCVQGYVWREAFEGDDVCVLGDVRSQAKQDNTQAASRVVPQGG